MAEISLLSSNINHNFGVAGSHATRRQFAGAVGALYRNLFDHVTVFNHDHLPLPAYIVRAVCLILPACIVRRRRPGVASKRQRNVDLRALNVLCLARQRKTRNVVLMQSLNCFGRKMRCAEFEEEKQPQICYFLKKITYRFGLLRTVDVNHGNRGTSPPEFGVGDASANCPPPRIFTKCRSEITKTRHFNRKIQFCMERPYYFL